jgi:uncharacterized protein YkwD
MRTFVLFVALGLQFNILGQYTFSELAHAVKAQEAEELSAILRESERLFSEKLNQYRKIVRAKELKHKDHIWLTALNHCLWMREHKNLSHSEKKGSKYYTGSSPSARLAFVQASLKYGAIGENVAYTELFNEEINETHKLAELLAKEFFDLWKKSPGHRKNMIDKSYNAHAIVILKSGNRFYAVNVFYSDTK